MWIASKKGANYAHTTLIEGGGGPEEMIYNVVANKEILKVSKQGFQGKIANLPPFK